jgi:hypothetical protein
MVAIFNQTTAGGCTGLIECGTTETNSHLPLDTNSQKLTPLGNTTVGADSYAESVTYVSANRPTSNATLNLACPRE